MGPKNPKTTPPKDAHVFVKKNDIFGWILGVCYFLRLTHLMLGLVENMRLGLKQLCESMDGSVRVDVQSLQGYACLSLLKYPP